MATGVWIQGLRIAKVMIKRSGAAPLHLWLAHKHRNTPKYRSNTLFCNMCDLLGRRGRAGGRAAALRALYTGSLPACCYASAVYMCVNVHGRESEAQLKSILTQNISRTPSRPGIIKAAVHCSSRADQRHIKAASERAHHPFLCTPYGRAPPALSRFRAAFPALAVAGQPLAISHDWLIARLSGI